MPLVELRSVSKNYHLGQTVVPALGEIDLQIDTAEFVAVWGPSGSGKTTLCNLMGVIDRPSRGTVLVNGRDVSALNDDERSEHRNRSVGFIFQNFNLIQVLTALENVMLPLQIRGVPSSRARKAAQEMLERVGLEDCLRHRPDKLSGGQRQRVAIARALIASPALVIADEPTANLDTANAERIVEIMREFNRSSGATFIFSTHDQRLLDHVERLVELRDGHIVDDTRARPATGGGDSP